MHVIVERPALERRVLASLEAGRIPVVRGNCGSGRTSLLLRLESALGGSNAQYVDLAAAASTPERCLRVVMESSHLPASTGLDATSASPRAASLLRGASQLDPDEPPVLPVEPKPPRWLWVVAGAVSPGVGLVAVWPGVAGALIPAPPPRNNQGRSQKKPLPPPIAGAQE